MEEMDIILWIISGVISMNTLILSAVWREIKGVQAKIGKLGEKQAEFKVRLTSLESIKHECRFANRGK